MTHETIYSNDTNPDSCKARIKSHFERRRDDLKGMFNQMRVDSDDAREAAFQEFAEYGLSFDYVTPGTFEGQRRGYFRYQISCGGPADEFRFFCDENKKPVRIEYWFLDWFDGAKKILKGKDEELLLDVWEEFSETGTVDAEYKRAIKEQSKSSHAEEA